MDSQPQTAPTVLNHLQTIMKDYGPAIVPNFLFDSATMFDYHHRRILLVNRTFEFPLYPLEDGHPGFRLLVDYPFATPNEPVHAYFYGGDSVQELLTKKLEGGKVDVSLTMEDMGATSFTFVKDRMFVLSPYPLEKIKALDKEVGRKYDQGDTLRLAVKPDF